MCVRKKREIDIERECERERERKKEREKERERERKRARGQGRGGGLRHSNPSAINSLLSNTGELGRKLASLSK